MFDPFFYREVIKLSGIAVVMFLLKLLLLTALVSGIFKTYYLIHAQRGITPVVSTMFGEMEIRNGELITKRETPFALSEDLTGTLLDRLAGFTVFRRVPENFLVVDTKNSQGGDEKIVKASKVLLKESSVLFKDMRMEVPYELLVGKNFDFTVSEVQSFLQRNALSFVINFFVLSFFFTLSTVLLSAFFLSLAAYLFSIDKTKRYGYFIRITCFSITPVMIGSALVAASGVSAEWAWYIFIVLSTMIMFRGMMHASNNMPSVSDEKNSE
jgi:ABC-type glycerol-3-phosphate transport system permease component